MVLMGLSSFRNWAIWVPDIRHWRNHFCNTWCSRNSSQIYDTARPWSVESADIPTKIVILVFHIFKECLSWYQYCQTILCGICWYSRMPLIADIHFCGFTFSIRAPVAPRPRVSRCQYGKLVTVDCRIISRKVGLLAHVNPSTGN